MLEASALRLSQEQQSQLVLRQLALPQHAPAQAEDVAMGRSIHGLVPPRPTQGKPPSGRLDFPLVTQESQGAAKSLARETTGGTRAAPGMFPCAGLRELVLPERALLR